VREAADAGRLRDIRLAPADLAEARENYQDFLESLEFLPDALDRFGPEGLSRVHRDKMDQIIIQELSNLLGVITRDGDWLELPRGVADGYMLFLSNAVARKRKLAKFTDSESIFVAMQYFDVDGNIGEIITPGEKDDAIASLILTRFVPDGVEDISMKRVLNFSSANRDGREFFRSSVIELADEMTKIENPDHLREVAEQAKDRFEEAGNLNLARIREHFSQAQPLLIYLGLPLAGKVLDAITGNHDSVAQLASFGIAGIAALADIAKSGRKDWVSKEATYYCKLKQDFGSTSPIPRRMRRLDRMMEEFVND
jgi:hypothetical protein